MKKVISLFLVLAMMIAVFTVSFSASFSVSDKDDEGKTLIWSAKDALADYIEETGEEVETKRIYFQMPNGNRGKAATDDHYVTITDYAPQVDPETGEPVLDPETGEPVMEPVGSHDEIAIHAGEKAPTWYNEYNVLDGHTYAACYWWGGTCDPESSYSQGWCGYRAEIEDEKQGIYYIDLPDDVTTIIWNNGVNGGMDSTQPIYYKAAQTVDTNCEGAFSDEYETIPYGSPDPYYFEDCIYVIDPDSVDVNPLTNKQTCGANWYVYYGNGCYGQEFPEGKGDSEYPDGTPDWSEDMQDVCKNPDHFNAQGVHVGYQEETGPTEHVHTPAAAVTENEVKPTYKAGGSYDSVVYCSECEEEISRETITTDPIALDPSKLYFDVNGTGWNMGAKDKVAFHIFGGDLENGLAWGAKKAQGTATAGTEGLFEIDPVSKLGLTFTPGVQYKIIFTHVVSNNWAEQTYDLLFTTDCFGHVAYCDGTEYENPVDSSKKTLAAFWYGMDSSLYGPVLQISSIGNVVGTCPETGKTPASIFADFISVIDDTTGKTKLDNARVYVVDVGTKTEQKLIDDIGADLGLTKQDVYDAFTNNEVETTWDYTVSTLPGEVIPPVHEHTPGEAVQENVNPATCKAAGSYDEVVYCTSCGEEISRTAKTIAKLAHTPAAAIQENVVPATCTAAGSYDEVVYCSVCNDEISRTQKTINKLAHTLKHYDEVPATETATGTKEHYQCTVCKKYFSDANGNNEVTAASLIIPMLAHTHTPGAAVQENVVPATCKAAGSYDEVVYCTSCGAEISRTAKTIAKLAHTPGAAVQENVNPATCKAAGSYDEVVYCSVCGDELSRTAKTIAKLNHTPGDAVQENVVPATCKAAGSYDEVVYCSVCGDELSRTAKTIAIAAHTIKYVAEVPATVEAAGTKAHYECSVCKKLFSDAQGKNEVTAASLVIPKLPVTGILGDVDGSGEVDIIDVTIIQRVLAGLKTATDTINKLGDVDKSNTLDTVDATLIQRWLLGLNQNLGIGKAV